MAKLICWLGFHKWEASPKTRMGICYSVPKCKHCNMYVWQVDRRRERRLR